jgi:transmembrane sensor
MLTDADWVRIVRFLFDECGPSESARERAWVDADPERHAVAQELLALRSAAPPPEPPWQTDRAWARFRDATAFHAGQPDAAPPHRQAPHLTRPPLRGGGNAKGWGARLLRAAVGFAAAAIVGVLGALAWSAHAHTVRQTEMRELVTTPGQRVTLTLTDGTRITLGPASTIRYPREFSKGRRAVELEGEGYFEVHHNPRAPLIVRTPRAQAEDIGTTFVVRDYKTDSEPQVTVAEGQVSMGPSSTADTTRQKRPLTLLSRGQVGALTSDGTTTVREDVDLGPEDGWARGDLVFRHARLRDVLPELNRWFDMDIRLAEPSLGDLEVTTAFKDESVNDALNALTAALGLVADGQGREIVLRRTGVRRSAQIHRRSTGVSFTSLDPGEAPHAP